MVEDATVIIFSLSVAFQAIPLAAIRTPDIVCELFLAKYIRRKKTYSQFLGIDHNIFFRTVLWPWSWCGGERDAESEFEIGTRSTSQRKVGHTGYSSFHLLRTLNMDTPETRSRDTQERTFCKWYVI
jgi:hypothetical protein